MFKYSNKQHLRKSAVSSASGVRGGTLAVSAVVAYLQPRKRTWWIQLWLFSSVEICLFETKNCHVHHCLANSRTSQDQFIFQDFPGPENFPIQFQDYPGGVVTLSKSPGAQPSAHVSSTDVLIIKKHDDDNIGRSSSRVPCLKITTKTSSAISVIICHNWLQLNTYFYCI